MRSLDLLTSLFATVLVTDPHGLIIEQYGSPFAYASIFAAEAFKPIGHSIRAAIQGQPFDAIVEHIDGTFRVRGVPYAGGAIIGLDKMDRPVLQARGDTFASREVEFLIRNLRQGLWRLSVGNRIETVNDWLVEWLESSREEMIGRSSAKFLIEVHQEVSGQCEATFRTSSGRERRAIISGADLESADGEPIGRIEVVTDVTKEHAERMKLVEEMQAMAILARTDGLTSLGNRLSFQEQLRILEQSDRPFGLVIADVDSFKTVNDEHGHETGNEALQEVARRLRSCVRRQDLVVRLGGDEFAILVPDASTTVLEEVVRRLEQRMTFDLSSHSGRAFDVSVSVGAAHSDAGRERVLDSADQAMYRRKRERRSGRSISG